MDDPWVSGTGRCDFDVDAIGASPDNGGNMRSGVASDRGTLRIENGGGAWEGPCDGVSLDGGRHIIGSCILTGSGEYEGYTYLQVHDWGSGGTTTGVIFSGSYPDEPCLRRGHGKLTDAHIICPCLTPAIPTSTPRPCPQHERQHQGDKDLARSAERDAWSVLVG